MDEILKKQLQDGGIDTDEIMERMMGSEALMKKLLKKFLSDTNFSTLEKALSENDVEEAFRAAHTLKGVAGTLALTGMHSIAAEITELLRNDSILQAKNKFPELADAYDSVIKMIEKLSVLWKR
jgi:HPt (histidine-containing phosphotransfer) domain-containing protein